MDVTILLYDDMTALDAIGPYEALHRAPGAKVEFVGLEAGPVTADSRVLDLRASNSIEKVERTDILLIPGGPGSRVMMKRPSLLEHLRRLHETTTYTTSVCTGSLILGAVGLLKGVPATTFWGVLDQLAEFGAAPTRARYVQHGKIITAAGVSAGIDMSLHLLGQLYGRALAEAVQLGIEYDPAPPFDSGSPDKASAECVAFVRRLVAEHLAGLPAE